MAAKKKGGKKASKRGGKKASKGDGAMIISKSRTKAAVRKCNVGSDFYSGLESAVRDLIQRAEARALSNKRKTVRATDV